MVKSFGWQRFHRYSGILVGPMHFCRHVDFAATAERAPMNPPLSILFAVFAVSIGTTGFTQSQALIVEVDGIKGGEGAVVVALFDNEVDYLVRHKHSTRVIARGPTVTAVFENLAPGDYAVGVIHDLDKNGSLNKNRLGIPTEGFGFSNNEMGVFGPPSFEKAKISWPAVGQTLSVRMRYL